MTTNRFDDLMEALLDGGLQSSEVAEFDQLLVSDQALRQEALNRLAEHRLLSLIHQPTDDEVAVEAVMAGLAQSQAHQVESIMASVAPTPRRRQAKRNWLPWVVACAAMLMLVTLVRPFLTAPNDVAGGGSNADDRLEKQTTEVASLLLCQNCEWENRGLLDEGERLAAGPLRMKSGFAVLRFDGGAEVVIQGDAALELLSPGAARVHYGDVVVRAPEEAAGFKVETPASELLDLGTEFSVRVERNGATELDVLDGEVAVRPLAAKVQEPRVLKAGQAVAVDSAKSQPREINRASKRFATLIREARPNSRWELTHAYAGFNYDAGRLPLADSHRGLGWSGPWRERTHAEGFRPDQDLSKSLDIVHGRMNVAWPVPGGRRGMLRMPSGFHVRIRQMRKKIDLSKNGTYYVSFMLRVPAREEVRRQDDFRLTLRSMEDYFGESVTLGLPRHGGPRIQTGLGVGFRGRSPLPEDESIFCVGKILARQNAEDRIKLRVFGETEELESLEPREWDVVSRDLDLSARLDLVVITSAGPGERVFDELRIGPTWRSVVPLIGYEENEE